MTGLDQPEKGSRRAYIFRNAIDSCRKRAAPALTLSATSRPPSSQAVQLSGRAGS